MEAARITLEELESRRRRGESITFVDSRNPTAWAGSQVQVPGAIRIPVSEIESRLGELPLNETIVTYCT